MIPYDALIFDVDGTLWNACPSSAKGWNAGLEQLGLPQRVTAKQIESVAGKAYETCVETLLPGLASADPRLLSVMSEHEKHYIANEGGTFYPGALEGIKTLSHHYPVFLVSNCNDWYLELFLQVSGLRPFLKGVDCHGLSHLNKGEMLIRMQQHYGSRRPVYIGDTTGDEAAAQMAAMDFMHAAYGFGKTNTHVQEFDSFPSLLSFFLEGK